MSALFRIHEEPLLSLWGLKRLSRRFSTYDYTIEVVKEPERFQADDLLKTGTFKQR